jgi:hypothetical protein
VLGWHRGWFDDKKRKNPKKKKKKIDNKESLLPAVCGLFLFVACWYRDMASIARRPACTILL